MTNSTETERAELIAERAELIAKNEAATSWGAAVGARHERIVEIDRRLAALCSFAQDQEPVASNDLNCATGRSCEYGPHGPNGEQQCQYCGAAPPPAAGWDEAIEAAKKVVGSWYDSPNSERAGTARTICCELEALRHNAPPDTGAGKSAPAVLTYTNYRGETSVRSIIPRSVRYGSTEWHPEPQWLLLAYDTEKQANREFALKDFGVPDHGGADAGVRVTDDMVTAALRAENVECDPYNEGPTRGSMRAAIEAALSHQPAPVAANASAGPDWKLSDDTKARIAEIDDNLRNAALNAANVVAANTSAELQNDLGEMLLALGMSDAAQPRSPHEVFQSAIAEMKRQLGNASAEARLRVIDECSDALGYRREYLRTLLSAHPHASDCAGQESRAKATEGKAGMAGGQAPVRRSTAGTGLRVGAAGAVQPATSEIMDVTAGRDRQLSEPRGCPTPGACSCPSDRSADVTVEVRSIINGIYGLGCGTFAGGHQDKSIERAVQKIVAIVDCDKQGWLAKDVEAATKRVAEWNGETTKSEGGR